MSIPSKKILIISPFFYPEPISTGVFNTNLVKEIKQKVDSITVLCFHPFYPKWKVKKSSLQINDVQIIRGGKNIFYPKNGTFRRIILEVLFSVFVFRKFFSLRSKVDTIVSVLPPSLFFSLIGCLIPKRVKIVFLVHDLQEVYASQKKGIINLIIRRMINVIEQKNFKAGDKVIFFSKEMKETAQNYYSLDSDKLSVHYPFITIGKNRIRSNLKELLPKERRHIVYSGALGEKQNPQKLYDFFDFASSKIENGQFHIFSEGVIFEKLKSHNKNDNIKFHGLVDIEDLYELYKRSSVQIIPQKEGTSKGSLPSKLPNVLATGCKILIISDKGGEIERLFKKFNLKTVATIWDNEILLCNLKEILDNETFDEKHQISIAKELFATKKLVEEIIF